jgi:hypothetical protein
MLTANACNTVSGNQKDPVGKIQAYFPLQQVIFKVWQLICPVT